MAKVVLIQYWMMDHLGLMTITAYLKRYGHEAVILVKHEEKNFIKKVASLNPDVVGFACTTGIHSVALQDIVNIKKFLPKVVTLMGGPHATFVPEIVEKEGLDIACRGEGEEALVELCNRIDQKREYVDVKNLWVKREDKIYKNDIRPLIEDLDVLPFPDRSHYDFYKVLKRMPSRHIATGRGCVFNCSFCSNGALKSMYKGKGKFVRRRSVGHVLEEIKQLQKRHYVKYISFEDDDILDNHEWMKEFLSAYKQQIQLPFICLARFDNLTEEMTFLLKDSGCYLLELGIDSGNETVRERLLNKSLKTSEIIHGASLLKKHKLKFRAYNIIGFPGETVDEALDTLDLNTKIKTDFPAAFVWQPYPQTHLAKKRVQDGGEEVDYADFSPSFLNKSIIKQENIKELECLQKLFSFLVRVPLSRNFIKKIIRMQSLQPIYNLIYNVIYLNDVSEIFRITRFKAVIMGLRMRKLY